MSSLTEAPVAPVNRVDRLTPEQEARMPEWAAKWIGIGLRTGPADREAFERHVGRCYQAAGLEPPKRVVWVSAPFVLAFAAPAAALSLEWRKAIEKDPRVAAALLRGITPSAVHSAVHSAVDSAVGSAVGSAVDSAVGSAVDSAVRSAVDSAVDSAVRSAVGSAVDSAVDSAVRSAVGSAIQRSWYLILGGQLWAGWGWGYGSSSYVSFLREVGGLDLGDEMNARATAYAGTVESACWWWPHKDFVMVCERPVRIDRDAQGRLHSLTAKAIEWPDGWGVYRINGVTVPDYVVEHPEEITVARIDGESNAEVRRVMVERYGAGRFMRDSGAKRLHQDETGTLYERRFADGSRALAAHVLNSTVEPDGRTREFWLRVHPELRPLLGGGQLGEPQELTARNAVASTFGLRGERYAPVVQS